MKILILGAGQVGSTAAYSLAREEANEVTIVDRNPACCASCRTASTSAPSSATPPTRRCWSAPAPADADILIALTNSDEVNMVACQVAYTLFRTPTKIARIRSAEYTGPRRSCSRRARCRWTCASVPSSWSPSTSSS
jgi:trk system potassium uptake protein